MSVTSSDISACWLGHYTCANTVQPLPQGSSGALPLLLQSPQLHPLAVELVREMWQYVGWLFWTEIPLPSLLSKLISPVF